MALRIVPTPGVKVLGHDLPWNTVQHWTGGVVQCAAMRTVNGDDDVVCRHDPVLFVRLGVKVLGHDLPWNTVQHWTGGVVQCAAMRTVNGDDDVVCRHDPVLFVRLDSMAA